MCMAIKRIHASVLRVKLKLALPAIHLISQDDIISSTDSFRGWDGGAVACPTDIAVQALKLNVLDITEIVSVQASIGEDI